MSGVIGTYIVTYRDLWVIPAQLLPGYFSYLKSIIGWFAMGQCWLLTCSDFPLGIAFSRSRAVMKLQRGEEPWVYDQVDMTSATEREAQRGLRPGEWTLGKGTMSKLGSKLATLTVHISVCFQGQWPHSVSICPFLFLTRRYIISSLLAPCHPHLWPSPYTHVLPLLCLHFLAVLTCN